MKRVMNKFAIIAMALWVTFTLTSTQQLIAGNRNDSGKTKGESPVEFNYVGKLNNQPLFQLKLNNVESGEFAITLTDQTGAVLYNERVEGVDLSRKYLLNLDEIDASEIKFQVRNKKDNSVSYFTVKRNYSLVDEWNVKS